MDAPKFHRWKRCAVKLLIKTKKCTKKQQKLRKKKKNNEKRRGPHKRIGFPPSQFVAYLSLLSYGCTCRFLPPTQPDLAEYLNIFASCTRFADWFSKQLPLLQSPDIKRKQAETDVCVWPKTQYPYIQTDVFALNMSIIAGKNRLNI